MRKGILSLMAVMTAGALTLTACGDDPTMPEPPARSRARSA